MGRSTLVADLAATDYRARYVNLDDEATANAARADPTGLIAGISEPAVIDEIQRVPGLLLAINQRLDSNRSRGQFLLTGSANILTLPTVTDALPGRIEYLNLWPLSQGELRDRRETFIDDLFEGRFPEVTDAPVGRDAVAQTLAIGDYPEQGRSPRGRSRFFSSYAASIIGRDLDDVANVRNVENVERLLFVIAARSGGLTSFTAWPATSASTRPRSVPTPRSLRIYSWSTSSGRGTSELRRDGIAARSRLGPGARSALP